MRKLMTLPTIGIIFLLVAGRLVGAEPKNGTSAKGDGAELSMNASFEVPFLGRVKAHAEKRVITYKDKDGKRQPFELRVLSDKNSRFMRAEYFRKGAKDFELGAAVLGSGYVSGGDKIVGIPKAKPLVSLQHVMDSLHQSYGGNFERATKFNVTYVMLSQFEEPAKPIFIINLWGTEKISVTLPNDPAFKALRFLFDSEGKLIGIDNHL